MRMLVARVTNTGVLKIPVIMILHCITLRSGSGTQGMQAKFKGPHFWRNKFLLCPTKSDIILHIALAFQISKFDYKQLLFMKGAKIQSWSEKFTFRYKNWRQYLNRNCRFFKTNSIMCHTYNPSSITTACWLITTKIWEHNLTQLACTTPCPITLI